MNLPSMWDQLDGTSKVDGSMRRAAQLRKDITAWRKQGESLRRRMEESRLESKMEGILFDVELSPSERASSSRMSLLLLVIRRYRRCMRTMAADPKPVKRIVDHHAYVLFHDSRSNASCIACTNQPGNPVEAHHLVSRAQGGDDVLSNLVPFCRSCHTAFHNGNQNPKRMLARFLRSDAGADHVEYLNGKRGAFGAENYVLKLEGKVQL